MTNKKMEEVLDDFDFWIDSALEWKLNEMREGAEDNFFDKYENSGELFDVLITSFTLDRDNAMRVLKDIEAIENPDYKQE
jgi:hypothetical protein